jgi:radical SAM superfamily enzyme YgiQ (UPF0313 family)
MSARRIALVCMTPSPDTDEHGPLRLPSYGIHRILAATMADPNVSSAKVSLIDAGGPDPDAYVSALEQVDADLIGFSIYVWSTPCLVEVARRIKRRRPDTMIVFGGPSARTALFDLPSYAPASEYLDAIVSVDGETIFPEIARLRSLTREGLSTVPGIYVAADGGTGWKYTGARPPMASLDDIPSPFQLGLMPARSVAYLETYRGCPLGCRFCEWGAKETSKAVFSTDYIARELQSFAEHGAPAVFLLDAGLNLNAQGFRNLVAADARVGMLRSTKFWAEIYPTLVRDEHLEFLSRVGASYLGVGLQSLDERVLALHDRPFDRGRFERNMRALASVTTPELQIIFGLPGDSPQGFRQTLDYARSFGIAVRAYHCLVLPDALMTRGRPEWRMQYDPATLAMIECDGWTREEITAMRAELARETERSRGHSGNYWWSFPPPR